MDIFAYGLDFRVHRNMRNDLQAINMIPIEGAMTLRVHTCKVYGGNLVTTASVVFITDSGFRTMPMRDYRKTIFNVKIRCTEKAVESQHRAALQQIEAIKKEIDAHYPDKAAAIARALVR